MSDDYDYRTYPRGEEPDVEVEVEGQWHPGDLQAWTKRDGSWWAHVVYSTGPAQTYRSIIPAERVRPAT